MSLWTTLAERLREQRNELARKALKKAGQVVVSSAGKVAGAAGKAIGKVVFGAEDQAATVNAEPPDPFARLKAAEAEKKAREGREGKR